MTNVKTSGRWRPVHSWCRWIGKRGRLKKKNGCDSCAWASAFNLFFFFGALSTHRPPTTDTTSSVKVCENYHPFYNVAVSCTQVCIPDCKVEKQQYSSVLGELFVL